MAKNKPRIQVLRRFLSELEWTPTKRYVEMLRQRDELWSLDEVDVDLPQVVERRFLCDARRCIQWNGDQALVDRSCCCRYEVPVTTRDRRRLLNVLDAVRARLPEDHVLQDLDELPYTQDDDYAYNLVADNPLGGCTFSQYIDGRCRCTIHGTALEQGDNPCTHKPLACSLWPLATVNYEDGGEERLLLTIYCDATAELFSTSDDEPFACIEDQDPSYPRLYQAEETTLRYIFGDRFYHKLDKAAGRWLQDRDEG